MSDNRQDGNEEAMSVHRLSDYGARRRIDGEAADILGQTEELALDRLLLTIAKMLEQLAELLFSRAEQAVKRDETNLYLAARSVVQRERQKITEEFERILRHRIDDEISGEAPMRRSAERSTALDRDTLTLVDPIQMELNVAVKNLSQALESSCHDELMALNQRLGHLLGDDELDHSENPLSPEAICEAFREAWERIDADNDIKLAVLKQINQGLLSDIGVLYSDLNRHLVERNVLPHLRPSVRKNPTPSPAANKAKSPPQAVDGSTEGNQSLGVDAPRSAQSSFSSGASGQAGAFGATAAANGDLYTTLQNLLLRSQLIQAQRSVHTGGASPSVGAGDVGSGQAGGGVGGFGNAVGEFGMDTGTGVGKPSIRISSSGVVSALTRLQHGESSFVLDNGSKLELQDSFDQAKPNVLRDIRDSTLGHAIGQEEALTIELVAMLFDYIFEDPQLSDAIKASLGRLQIPVLKAAMLNKEFFSKKTHPARLLVNKLSEAGMKWSPALGHEDPLYKKIAEIVHKVQSDFVDRIELFSELQEDLEKFLAEEERTEQKNIETSAAEIERADKAEIAKLVANSEVENCLSYAKDDTPGFLSGFLRARWITVLQKIHLNEGDKSAAWSNGLRTMAELIWSVQPKRNAEERQHLVSLLPDLLRRMKGHLQAIDWTHEEQSHFLEELIAAHASAVKAATSSSSTDSQAQSLSNWRAKMTTLFSSSAESVVAVSGQNAQQALPGGLARGKWVEFTVDDGTRVSYKFSWISPLRGILLFTNRNGLKAFSLTREEFADKFRFDRARVVNEEPLVDRALNKILERLNQMVVEAPIQ